MRWKPRFGTATRDAGLYDQAAADIAAARHREGPEVQQAYRYLFARVALEAGILELIGHEIRSTGERLVCREVTSGKFYAADRPVQWTCEEEAQYVAEMRIRLLSEDNADAGSGAICEPASPSVQGDSLGNAPRRQGRPPRPFGRLVPLERS